MRTRHEALRAQILKRLASGFIDFGEDVNELGQEAIINEGRSFTVPVAYLSETVLPRDCAQNIIDSIRPTQMINAAGRFCALELSLLYSGLPNAGKSILFNFLGRCSMLFETLKVRTTQHDVVITLLPF